MLDFRIFFNQLDNPNNTLVSYGDSLFLITFVTSVFSSAWGMTMYLKLGPCRILPKNGFCGGFPLVMLSVGSTLVGKGLSFAAVAIVVYFCVDSSHVVNTKNALFGIWILFNILPQVIYVSIYEMIEFIKDFSRKRRKMENVVNTNTFKKSSGTFYFPDGNWY